MGELTEAEVSQERLMELVALLRQAFGDVSCLRCKANDHLVRGFIVPGLKEAIGNGDVVETTCKRCGFVETHRVAILEESVRTNELHWKAMEDEA